MIKIRLQGTLEDLERSKAVIRSQFNVLSESEPYQDRGMSKLYRIYVECEVKSDGKREE